MAIVFTVHTLRRRFSIWGVMFASLMTLSCFKPSYDTLLPVLDQFYDTTYDLFFHFNAAYGLSGHFSLGLVHTVLVEDHDWSIFRVGYNCIPHMSLYSVSMLDAHITHITYCMTWAIS